MKTEDILETATSQKPLYEKPEVKIVSESELLVAFQVTQAAITWWVM